MARLLSRVPPLVEQALDHEPFALRDGSLPPPRTGRTVADVFPPPAAREGIDVTPAGPLQVVRRGPEGDVPLAPSLSVTFSQPMVAVTSHVDLARDQVPVRLFPLPDGKWRWVGTKTLLFEPTTRFPMATDYGVSIPAGTRSATGGALQQPVQWTFSTPGPSVVASFPKDQVTTRTPIVFVAFDQRIVPDRVLATIRLRAGASDARLRLATKEEVDSDEQVRALASAAEADRWLAFRPLDALPPGAAVAVSIGPGTPSAEGPKAGTRRESWGFRTFGRLRVSGRECGWESQCPPRAAWTIVFSNLSFGQTVQEGTGSG